MQWIIITLLFNIFVVFCYNKCMNYSIFIFNNILVVLLLLLLLRLLKHITSLKLFP